MLAHARSASRLLRRTAAGVAAARAGCAPRVALGPRSSLRFQTGLVPRDDSRSRLERGPPPEPDRKARRRGLLYGLAKWTGIALLLPVGYVLLFFAYDVTTYKSGPLQIDVEIPHEALDVKRGGPKNLPYAGAFIDELELGQDRRRPNLVILGSGWAAVSLLKSVDTSRYNVTVVSPVNHFLFTPLLPSAAAGTLALETLVEPIRRMCYKKRARYLQAEACDIVLDQHLVEMKARAGDGEERRFYMPYDKLVVATGAASNTHGVPGLENAFFFKTALDAARLREAIHENLEIAALPSTPEEERKKLLSFVICGGGPTGVELAAEIFDLLKEDVPKNFPHLLVNLASVHIIQSRNVVLNTYDEQVSRYAMNRFMNDGIDLQTNSRVEKVTKSEVIFSQKDPAGKKIYYSVPAGLTIWTTGVTKTKFSETLLKKLKEHQHNRNAIETDAHLRVIGASDVYAIGDCSTVRTSLADNMRLDLKRIIHGAVDENGALPFSQIKYYLSHVCSCEPQARAHVQMLVEALDDRYWQDDLVPLSEVEAKLREVDKKVLSLPATAQRANQQGRYLGRKLNRLAKAGPKELFAEDPDAAVARPFHYRHLGQLAYLGNSAVFDTKSETGFNILGGIAAMYLWRSVYISESVTLRQRFHMFTDWLSRGLFGRQIYAYSRTK